MKVHIDIEQIDNGFILTLFDHEGTSENDKKLFYEKFRDVITKIEEWRRKD